MAVPAEPLRDPIEDEVISFFVHLARLFNLPKSVGEIYGLLFSSAQPLNMDELMVRLKMSKGAVSQGLKVLRDYGAIKVAYVQGDRRDHFAAETGMRGLVSGFIKDQLSPQMESASARLDVMEALLKSRNGTTNPQVAKRIKSLRSWESKGRRMIPLLRRLLEL